MIRAETLSTLQTIRACRDIFLAHRSALPIEAGVYVFWWIGSRSDLMASNRHISIKGPGGRRVAIEFMDWWPSDLPHPCLYVGKTTNIRQRFAQHVMRKSPGRLHNILDDGIKLSARTTTCQLRYGIEHLFRSNPKPIDLIERFVGFSYSTDFIGNPVVERFFTEDWLVGSWRPWFNIDSER